MRLPRLATISLLALSASAVPALADATIKGMVYDEKDKPVDDALVRLYHKAKGEKKLEEVARTESNDDGGFRIKKVDDGTYIITVNKKGLRDRTTVVVKDDKDPAMLNFKIREIPETEEEKSAKKVKADYVNFVGQVVDEKGDAVKGATVKLVTGAGKKDDDKMVTVDTTESMAKGRFEFYKVRFGNYYVDVTYKGKHARKEVKLDDSDGTQSVQVKL